MVQPRIVLPDLSGRDRRLRQRAGSVVALARRPSAGTAGSRSRQISTRRGSYRCGLRGSGATIRPLLGVPGWWALAATFGVAAVIEADDQACPPAVTLIGCRYRRRRLVIGAASRRPCGPLFSSAGLGLGAGIVCLGPSQPFRRRSRESLGTANDPVSRPLAPASVGSASSRRQSAQASQCGRGSRQVSG